MRKNGSDSDKAVADIAADVIRVELARKRANQGQLAELLGLSQPAIHRRMSGKVPWRISELTQVAEYLGVTVSALLADDAEAASA